MRVQAAPPAHFEWIENRTGWTLTRNARAIEAVDEAGKILGMVAYDGWTETAAQAHIAVTSPQVWTRLLRPAFDYAFRQAERQLLIGIVSSANPRSLAFTAGIGFREKYRVVDGQAVGVDLVIFEMRREECRWIRSKK